MEKETITLDQIPRQLWKLVSDSKRLYWNHYFLTSLQMFDNEKRIYRVYLQHESDCINSGERRYTLDEIQKMHFSIF